MNVGVIFFMIHMVSMSMGWESQIGICFARFFIVSEILEMEDARK